MALCYTVILLDEFDWRYVNTNKEKKIEDFINEFEKVSEFRPEVEAQWSRHIVFDLEKNPPDFQDYKQIIEKYCDSAWYWNDTTPYKKEKL